MHDAQSSLIFTLLFLFLFYFQDALEFFQHLLEQVEKNHAGDAREDPSRCFKFCVEERIMCSVTKKVKYTRKADNVLSLNIPLRAAVNKG